MILEDRDRLGKRARKKTLNALLGVLKAWDDCMQSGKTPSKFPH